ncbi:MAG: helix-turn-helix domain-containing protein [Pseudomonadota bacterium]
MSNIWKWRQRLEEAIEKSGRSMTEISEAAGYSHGYLYSILRGGRDMTLTKLLSVCTQIGVSPTYIISGIELSDDDEELLNEINSNPDALDAVRAVVTAVKRKEL